MLNANDIYFDPNYGKLYENAELGKAEIYVCETKNGRITNQFIKRTIPIKIDDATYYDIVTPYGYGGPIIEQCKNKEELLLDFESQFKKYCQDNNIIAEFVRFHPICKNYQDFGRIYDCTFDRYTLATNIKDYDDPVRSEFSKHCRKTIRQVLKKGISYKIIEKPTREDIAEFQTIYYQNMKRKNAEEYYFFNDKYFDDIYKYFKDDMVIAESLLEDEVIAAGLYFTTNKIIHAHLSGTKTEFLQLSPAYILKYGTALWAKEHQYNYIHYGGGTDRSVDNPLFMFKSKFANNTRFEFWIGKKIWNSDIYARICDLAGADASSAYFPAYREPKI